MHLKSIHIYKERYPRPDVYPFNLSIFHKTRSLSFDKPVAIFVGENGTGKSTLLKAICRRCGIHMWEGEGGSRFEHNPYEDRFSDYISVEWVDGKIQGSYFGSDIFQTFVKALDEWAATDAGQLDYFGGKSLMTQSHGQSLMSFFRNRYRVKGLYLLDEPETALSPRRQLELVSILVAMAAQGHAQFIMASHSPILLACPGAALYSFDRDAISPIRYEDTDHFRLYREFMADRGRFLP
ncbi:MAG: AAA family ATPase [Smithellaceae bacterium]|nr:AAA family ATPase [Smithellaceae bacterium]